MLKVKERNGNQLNIFMSTIDDDDDDMMIMMMMIMTMTTMMMTTRTYICVAFAPGQAFNYIRVSQPQYC